MKDELENFTYNPEESEINYQKVNQLCAKIRDAVQTGTFRYKICVQAFLGERKNQKVDIVAKGWWDSYVDNYCNDTFMGENFYCTVIVWGMYVD